MKSKAASAPYLVWMVLFIVVPMLLVAYFAFTDSSGAFTLENIARVGQYSNVFLRSIWLGAVSTVICLVLGYPVAYLISRSSLKRQSVLLMLIMLPMWMNFLLRTYAWMSLLETNGIINTLLSKLGLPALQIMYTEKAVILGMVYNFLPFMILPIYNTLIKLDPSLLNASDDLGASPWQTFTRVTLPLSKPAILSGINMVFMPSVTTFVISRLLGGSSTALIGDIIEKQFKLVDDKGFGSAMSVIIMIFVFGLVALTREKDSEEVSL